MVVDILIIVEIGVWVIELLVGFKIDLVDVLIWDFDLLLLLNFLPLLLDLFILMILE